MPEGFFPRFRLLSLMAVCVLCGTAFAPSMASASTGVGAIEGTVTAIDGGAPIEGIEVCAYGEGGSEGFGCATTEAAGKYVIEALPEADYEVGFFGQGWVEWWFGEVQVLAGQTTPLSAALEETGAIAGTVTSALGGPIADGFVCVDATNGRFFNACGFTDDAGRYLISGLLPAEYEVEFTGQVCDSGSGCERESCELQVSCSRPYITQVYIERPILNEPGTTRVPVEAGHTAEGIDATLRPGGKIEGSVKLAALHVLPLAGVEACALAEVGIHGECATTNAEGKYAIEGLASGGYKVVFHEACGEAPCPGTYTTQYFHHKAAAEEGELISLTAPGVTTGVDGILAEAAPQGPAFVTDPTLTGPATVGSTLVCSEGTWTGNPTGIAYSWQRNGFPIAGQDEPTYKATGADEGASLTCSVKLTNTGGSADAASNALAISAARSETTKPTTTPQANPTTGAAPAVPPPAVAARPGRATVIGDGFAQGRRLRLRVKCAAKADCSGFLKLLYPRRARARKGKLKLLKLAGARVSVAAGAMRTVRVRLDNRAARLIRRAGGRGLIVTLTGNGVRSRPLLVKPRRLRAGRGSGTRSH